MSIFTGCGTAIVTPFRHDLSLDESALCSSESESRMQSEIAALFGRFKAALNDGEGTVIKRRAVLGSGTILTRSTPVYDIVGGEIYSATAHAPLVIPEELLR